MPEEKKDAPDLFDLKFLPAWVRETPNENRYADFAGEDPGSHETRTRTGFDRRTGERRERRPGTPSRKERPPNRRKGPQRPRETVRHSRPEGSGQPAQPSPISSFLIAVRFVPDRRVLDNVIAQIKAGHVAYSVFSLARMFLDRPECYDVRLRAESGELFQLGENGAVSNDARLLENGAFSSERNRFYRSEVTQTEPIRGNFQSVARCRLSGTLLGPTNHHAYQVQLRNLYERRFSRRMSFPEYQRQVEIVVDPELIERWKEEARTVTTYITLDEEPPVSFKTAAETERHFREKYLPSLLQRGTERTVDGVVSRRLFDRLLGRFIENAWAEEFRSPAKMMQELSLAFRQAGLHIFRHRKGMLFVTPIRSRPLGQGTSVSDTIAGIVAVLTENPGINRKQLLEKLGPNEDEEARERMKRALVADLHWLIGEGYVIEFNDGVLDLPRVKAAVPPETKENTANGAIGQGDSPNETRNEPSVTPIPSPDPAAPETLSSSMVESARPEAERSDNSEAS